MKFMRSTFEVLWHYARFKRRRWRDRAHLLRWQEAQVARFMARTVPKSAFYRGRLAQAGHWRTMPTVDKGVMMANFDSLNTLGLSREAAMEVALRAERDRDFRPTLNGVTVGLSSGTSGNRGLFVLSDRERHLWAGAILAKALPGPIWGRHSIAFFLRANSNVYETVNSRRITVQYYDLLTPVDEHIAQLNAQMPSILIGPPSMLRYLAEQPNLNIAPAKVVSVAEVLDPLDAMILEGRFGAPLHQIYQCTEGLLATTCEHGTLHLNEDMVVIQRQWIDEQARKFSPIVTDFCRTTQPIIRYVLDDVLTERAELCPCGSPMTALEHIAGRCDDIFLVDGVRVYPDYIRRAVIAASERISAYRVVQTAVNSITIYLTIEDESRAEVEAAVAEGLRDVFGRAGAAPPVMSFLPLEPERPGIKKRKRVECLL